MNAQNEAPEIKWWRNKALIYVQVGDLFYMASPKALQFMVGGWNYDYYKPVIDAGVIYQYTPTEKQQKAFKQWLKENK